MVWTIIDMIQTFKNGHVVILILKLKSSSPIIMETGPAAYEASASVMLFSVHFKGYGLPATIRYG